MFGLRKKKKEKQISIYNSKHGNKNCWEIKKCGREAGGRHVKDKGVCPAYPDHGRQCWAVTGTLCDKEVQGTFLTKKVHCFDCHFFLLVQNEEGKDFIVNEPSDKNEAEKKVHKISGSSSLLATAQNIIQKETPVKTPGKPLKNRLRSLERT